MACKALREEECSRREFKYGPFFNFTISNNSNAFQMDEEMYEPAKNHIVKGSAFIDDLFQQSATSTRMSISKTHFSGREPHTLGSETSPSVSDNTPNQVFIRLFLPNLRMQHGNIERITVK